MDVTSKLKELYSRVVEVLRSIAIDAFVKAREENKENQTFNETEKFIASYGMVLIAVVVNAIGVYMCAIRHKRKIETILSREELIRLPLLLSCSLFGIFCCLKFISTEYITLVLQVYTLLYGLISLSSVLSILVSRIWPTSLYPNRSISVAVSEMSQSLLTLDISISDLFSFVFATIIVGAYYISRHWTLNNIVAASFSFSLLENVALDRFWHSFLLFAGLFLYDIFWVYGTNVMVTVARKIDAPLMFKLPYSVLTPLPKINFSGLGLGDVAVPGLFLAFLARFDLNKNRRGFHYFSVGMISYVLALFLCTYIVNITGHGQPAFFYIVPLLFSGTFFQAIFHKELPELLTFNAETPQEKNNKIE